MSVPTPENTTARDSLMHLLGSMSAGTDGYITGMEADGQRQVVQSDVLPADAPWAGTEKWGKAPDVTLEDLGFVKGEPIADDDLFVRCTLPDGWSKKGTSHSMWSDVVDERGVTRVAVFYKAAFYDRHAHASITNVGYSLGSEAIYSEEPAKLPDAWELLSGEERAEFVGALDSYREEAAEHPSIYGDRIPKVDALQALLDADG